jgi:hypothetical protein
MRKLIPLILLIGALAPVPVFAQAPAPLSALVQQLQANPSDDALRRQIIERARGMRPAPTIPEEARRAFVEGTTLTQAATDAAGQRLALDSLNTALRIAPWWGDAYYNRAIVQDLMGDLSGAKASLELYLLTGPPSQDARQAQDRIYALDARTRLAAQAASAEQERVGWLVGNWQWETQVFSGGRHIGLADRTGSTSVRRVGQQVVVGNMGVRGTVAASGEIAWEQQLENVLCVSENVWAPLSVSISADRRRIEFNLLNITASPSNCPPQGRSGDYQHFTLRRQ